MDDSRIRPARHWSLTLRGLAVAILLCGAFSTTVFAASQSDVNQGATPAAGDGTTDSTSAAAPADSQAFVTLNLDPESAQFQDSAELSERAGFNDLVASFLDLGDVEAQQIEALLSTLALTEIGVAIPPVDIEAVEAASTAAANQDPTAATDIAETATVAVILASSDAETAFGFLTEQLPALAGLPADEVSESDYEGVTIVQLGAGDAGDLPVYLAQVDDLIVVSPTETEIQDSIDAARGNADDITTNAGYQQVTEVIGGESMLFSYADSASAFNDPAYQEFLSGMALDPALLGSFAGYSGLRVYADIAAPGFRVDTVHVPVGAAGGTPVAIPEYSSGMTAQVPDSTMIYLGGNDLGAMLAPIISIGIASGAASQAIYALDGSSDDGAAVAGTPELTEDENYDGIANLINSYVTLLAGEYVVAIGAPDMDTLNDPNSLFALFATEVSDSAPFEPLIDPIGELLFGADQTVSVTTEQINGNEIYTVGSADREAGTGDVTFSYGIVDGQLVLGLGDSVETYINGPATSLADDPQYQATFDALGVDPATGAVVYIDFATMIPLVLMGAEVFATEGPAIAGSPGSEADADPACAEYATQGDAQVAYDEDPVGLAELDLDFDGDACEDFFSTGSGGATPTAGGATDPLAIDFSAILSYGQVTSAGDGYTTSQGLLLLEEE
ncbi:MAG TPA: DUF3352 domain-containing protein [Thermomicrobiales bacterium]|nr:DUF3352 domain-containing protein [Thermomicrobiales bacterium]